MSRSRIYLLGLFLCGSLLSCVQIKKASLYDGTEPAEKKVRPTDISLLVEPLIFDDDDSDMWGLEKDACKEVRLTSEVTYSGARAIQLDWNRGAEGCDWAGIGIGWDGYAGKDLTDILDFAAVEFYVRTQEGKSFGLPIVLTLEDYSGGMGFSYTGNKYFERTTIDEQWQRVVVPLNTFDSSKLGLDYTNIKQLQLELQQSGSFYLDNIRLILYEAPEVEPWMEEEVLPDPTALPVTHFAAAFSNDNSWGLIQDACQSIELSQAERTEGERSVKVAWDTEGKECSLVAFGVSWNKWHPVDISAMRDKAAIQFSIKSTGVGASDLPIRVGFEDYDRAKRGALLGSAYVSGGQYGSRWETVTVPLADLPAGLDLTRIKHLFFQLEGRGEVYIDELRLVGLGRP